MANVYFFFRDVATDRSNATSNSGSSSSSGSTPLLSAKTGSLEAPSTANSPAHSSSSNNNNSNSGGETKKDESEDVWGYLEAQASFLGPSLWDNGDLKVRSRFSMHLSLKKKREIII